MRSLKRRVLNFFLWIVVIAIASFAVSLVVVLYLDGEQGEGAYQPLPEPELVSASVEKPAKKRQTTIAPSPATQVYIPSKIPELVISSKVHPLKCMPVIDPPTRGDLVGSVFGCNDFAQPSTQARGLTILSGHSSVRLDAAFNRLNKMGESSIGKDVLVRTKKSGKRWLVYRIKRMHRPLKQDLPYRTDIWGKAGQALPGRLVLVTCFMKEDGSVADYNLIMVAQFIGVR